MVKINDLPKNLWNDVKAHPKTYAVGLSIIAVSILAGGAFIAMHFAGLDTSAATSLLDNVKEGAGSAVDSNLLEIGVSTMVGGTVVGIVVILCTRLIQKKLEKKEEEPKTPVETPPPVEEPQNPHSELQKRFLEKKEIPTPTVNELNQNPYKVRNPHFGSLGRVKKVVHEGSEYAVPYAVPYDPTVPAAGPFNLGSTLPPNIDLSNIAPPPKS